MSVKNYIQDDLFQGLLEYMDDETIVELLSESSTQRLRTLVDKLIIAKIEKMYPGRSLPKVGETYRFHTFTSEYVEAKVGSVLASMDIERMTVTYFARDYGDNSVILKITYTNDLVYAVCYGNRFERSIKNFELVGGENVSSCNKRTK